MTRLVLTNATLVPGDGPVRQRASVVIDGETIESVSDDGAVEFRPDDRVVDLGGRTIMPGMVTAHYHPSYHRLGSTPLPAGFEEPPAYLTLLASNAMELAIDSGFTGAIGAGTGWGIDASLARAVEEGLIRGPRYIPCSRNLGTTGFSLDYSTPWYWDVKTQIDIGTADGADEFRKLVRGEIKQGARIVKLFATGGHLSITPEEQQEMTYHELESAISTAHACQAKARAHTAHPGTTLMAVKLGLDIVDHGDGLDTACIDAMLERGTFLAPSLRLPVSMAEVNHTYFPAEHVYSEIDYMLKVLPEANKAGLKMLLGDDYGVVTLDHGRYAEELGYYVNVAGIPALDVIRWATINGAEAMGMGDRTGSVVPGKLADLLVVDGDVVADVTILEDKSKLLAILKGGVFMKDELSAIERASIANAA